MSSSIGCYCFDMARRSGRSSGRHTGRTELDLTDTGREQAKLAADALAELRLDDPLVVSSPRKRAMVTAELAGLTVDEVSPLLAEWDYGDYEGLTTPEIRQTVPDWLVWTHGCPGGEILAAGQRTGRPRHRVALDHMESRDVVFVGHGHFSRAVLTRWMELPISEGITVRDGGRVDRGVRLRARRAPDQRTGTDGPRQPVPAGVTREPSFVLAGRGGVVVADGVQTAFPRIADAQGGTGVGTVADHFGRLAVRHVQARPR